MLIAFEGPDGVGKSTSARLLSHNGTPIYNATKENHKGARRELEQGSSAFGFGQDLVQTFDRIDWLTHMVYRLAMPNKEWNDERVRTVFAMPDTHLVIKLHRMDYDGNFFGAPPIQHAEDEGYKLDQLLKVNQAYFWFLQYFQGINHAWEYSLFRSLTAVDVWFDEDGKRHQTLGLFRSPVVTPSGETDPGAGEQDFTDEDILDLLRADELQRVG